MKINDVILQTVTRMVVFIILTLGVYLFLSGHNNPGGGFIGGLVLASAIVLLYLAYDIETVHKGIPFDFKRVAALGVLIAVTSGFGAILFDSHFLTQTFSHFHLPVFGETELATVTIFEAGVALAVVGVVVTIILSISEDE
ncbi:Na(+)/H(+) antiporter subunit B [Lederbergia lenta]|uniref:Putative monovalent cation/H+ antiporter subunit B n=1 Tax=Lederbergia lenta TaxID=1467 RepID=A0A2X4WEI5_LEDLE|nr:Na(+)/H(+) antiporter subunit B [Lederbergia lenta]MCM3111415.1 Na(+)/H(+) antiporter subunit B [Lederbergia lenta]MEC2325199.1 Na(+)/H(+) antiporter subunit B [Lederbergia lenta]SQI56040.1 putative monovalent cation/H+ antiporter subunit B [Lederbergia lenta]